MDEHNRKNKFCLFELSKVIKLLKAIHSKLFRDSYLVQSFSSTV